MHSFKTSDLMSSEVNRYPRRYYPNHHRLKIALLVVHHARESPCLPNPSALFPLLFLPAPSNLCLPHHLLEVQSSGLTLPRSSCCWDQPCCWCFSRPAYHNSRVKTRQKNERKFVKRLGSVRSKTHGDVVVVAIARAVGIVGGVLL